MQAEKAFGEVCGAFGVEMGPMKSKAADDIEGSRGDSG